MKKFNELRNELSETILLGKSIQMGDRRARIVKVVSIGGTSRYDTVYKVKFQDGTQVEMHDSQIRPFLIEKSGAGEEGTDELDDTYREDTPGEEVEEASYRRQDVYAIVDKKGKVVAAKLTKKNAHKEISRHRDGTIVLDPDAKTGDVLKTFAKESVEQLDETSAKEIESKGDKLFSDKYRRSFWYYKGYTWMIDFRGAHKLWKGSAPVKESVALDEGDLSDIIGNAILKSKKIKKGAKESDIISAINNELRNKKPKLSRNAIAFWMRDRDFLADTLGVVKRGLKESVEINEKMVGASDKFEEIRSKGKKLGDDKLGRSWFSYQGNLWMLKSGKVSNMGKLNSPMNKKTLKKALGESAPTNAVGGGMSPHFGNEGPVQGTDKILGKKKKRKKFAGAEVFELNSDEYHTCMHGRKKYERWNRRLNMENIDNQDIRSYAHKNPGKPIVVMDKTTGVMSYFYHGDKK
tara:strand:+ start:4286 stop:5677 length:1392 start_codon:yes stop_codon:yes gene_type:complete